MTTRRRLQGPLGEKLATLRGNLTQAEVARRAGVSLHLLKALEQGKLVNPTLQTLQKLAGSLRTTVAALVSDVEPLPAREHSCPGDPHGKQDD